MSTAHSDHVGYHGSIKSYILGYVSSLVLTCAAFALVLSQVTSQGQLFSISFLTTALIFLAISQFFIQLVFFLHLGKEPRPRWNLIVFLYSAVLLLALVLGSIWIMNNLNYNMGMTPDQMDAYMLDQ